jgi:BNR repeat-like domain
MAVIARFRWRFSIATAFILLALVLSLVFALFSRAFTFAAGAQLLQLSSDPFTNSTSQHRTEVEPDTLASSSTLVSAFQVGRFFNGGASDIGFATSTNGGKRFTNGFLPGATVNSTPPGKYARASDASVAFDAKHGVWLISFLGLFPNGNTSAVDVLVSRSTDGGLTWSNPVVVNNDGQSNDKNWTVCDDTASSPFYGNCYTEFDNNTLRDLIQMSTSTDGGLTWGAAQSTANNTHGIGGQPLVQPNGTVIVPINGFAGNKFLILSFISTDGGASWSKTFRVSEVDFRHPAGGIRAGIPLPSAEIDGSGKVYVVWSDCVFEPGCTASDLVLSTSSDGINWSAVTRIPLDSIGSGVDHFIPGLAVDRSTSDGSAHLVLTFYFYPVANCTTSTCRLDVGFSTSADGGATWTSNTQIAGPMTLSWLPNTTQGRMVADYLSTSFVSSPAFPAFAVASAPTSGGADCFTATPNCNQAIFTVQDGLSVGGSSNPANNQITVSSNAILTDSTLTAQ